MVYCSVSILVLWGREEREGRRGKGGEGGRREEVKKEGQKERREKGDEILY